MSHIHQTPGQVDHTVEVFIVYEGKVLLRKHEKYGIWLSVGGHIELDEDPNQAALREVQEEVGLQISLLTKPGFTDFEEKDFKELLPPVFLNRHRINPTHEHVTYTYFATTQDDTVTPESKDDIWRWLTENEVKSMEDLRPHIRHYALSALKAAASKLSV